MVAVKTEDVSWLAEENPPAPESNTVVATEPVQEDWRVSAADWYWGLAYRGPYLFPPPPDTPEERAWRKSVKDKIQRRLS